MANITHYQFSSVQLLSRVQLFARPHESQHTRPPCPSPTPGVHSDSRPSSRWCHPAISSSVVPFSSYPQSFQASGSFQMSQLFVSGGKSTGASDSTSVLPMNTQDWSPSEWTGWISLQSKGLSRVFSNTNKSSGILKNKYIGRDTDTQMHKTKGSLRWFRLLSPPLHFFSWDLYHAR